MMRAVAGLLLLACTTPLAAQTSLAIGRPASGTLAKGDTARFTVDADSGMLIRLTLEEKSVDAALLVRGPKEARVTRVDVTSRGIERVQFEVTETGAQRIQVIPADTSTGAFTITLTTREKLSSDPVKLVDQLLAPWDRRDGPGAAVQVWRGGRTLLAKSYGMANLTYAIPFAVNTPTNIGSTSKQFTAFAVMLLVEDGKVSLDDDVRKFFPELPDFGKPVTVRNLLTHTSGYREFLNALSLAGRRMDEGDYIDRTEIITLVQRQPALQNAPGSEWNYNNTAFALLSMLVERVSKVPFPEFMRTRVFLPIGMTHTQVRSDRHGTIPGASTGYSPGPDGTWRDLGDLGGAMGAGGIYTTIGDLQKWAEHLAAPRVGTAASIAQMMTPFTLTNGKRTSYGFGLSVDKQGPLTRVHHGGADISHRSMLAMYPTINAGVTVQSNDGTFNSAVAFRIATAFFPELRQPVSATPFAAASWDRKRFDAYVGRYALDVQPTAVLTFTRAGDTLRTQLTGQPSFAIEPTSDSTFTLRGVDAAITFQRNAQGKVTGLILHQGGDNHATRLEDATAAAKPWAPSATELAPFTGRFFSEELETFYDVSLVGGTLSIVNRRTDPASLVTGAKDAFTAANGTTLQFERDRNGVVVAFYAGNGRTRDVRFARVR